MYGDKLMIYNSSTGMFYAGLDEYRRVYADRPAPPRWCRDVDRAYKSNHLGAMKRKVALFGEGARIVSETLGRQIAMLRDYGGES